MKLRHLLVLVPAACLMAASAAAQPESAHRDRADRLQHCIDTTFTANWTPYNDHTVLVDSGGRTYRVTTSQCPRLTSILPQISTVVRGGSQICSPKDFDLYVSNSGRVDRVPCFVQSITQMTPEEARAFERRHRH